MVDLYLSLGLMLSLCGLAAFAGASLQDRARQATIVRVELLVCLVAGAYLLFLWDRPIISVLMPFSSTIILGNWLPVFGSFLLGVCLKTERIALLRRVGLSAILVAISGYSLMHPVLGNPPECMPVMGHRTLDFQTTDRTCSAACAVGLLRLHGVSATESELADLCLTRKGTHWLGVYRGLKLKTMNTNWDVVVQEVGTQELFSGRLGPGLLAMSFHATESGDPCDLEWGFESSSGHSVLVLSVRSGESLDVFDPDTDCGFETWTDDALRNLHHAILLRLVPRNVTQPAVKFDLAALKRDSDAYPPVVRR
jgi:hypothetical protein